MVAAFCFTICRSRSVPGRRAARPISGFMPPSHEIFATSHTVFGADFTIISRDASFSSIAMRFTLHCTTTKPAPRRPDEPRNLWRTTASGTYIARQPLMRQRQPRSTSS